MARPRTPRERSECADGGRGARLCRRSTRGYCSAMMGGSGGGGGAQPRQRGPLRRRLGWLLAAVLFVSGRAQDDACAPSQKSSPRRALPPSSPRQLAARRSARTPQCCRELRACAAVSGAQMKLCHAVPLTAVPRPALCCSLRRAAGRHRYGRGWCVPGHLPRPMRHAASRVCEQLRGCGVARKLSCTV